MSAMVAMFVAGVIVGLLIAGVIAINVWSRRNPMTPEEREQHDIDAHNW
jgi:hypothetical protein